RDLFADQVGAGRERLAELDEARAQLPERDRQALALAQAAHHLGRRPDPAGDAQEGREAHDIAQGEERIVPGQGPADPDKRPQMTQRAKHVGQSRQPECIAAMPPERLRYFTWSKPTARMRSASSSCGGKRRMLSAR